MTQWKSKIGVVSGVISATESESEESERFHFLPTPLTTPSLTFRLWSSENQIVGVGSRSRRTKPITKRGNVHCDWFILPLLLPTPTIWFSLDHKRNVSDGIISGIGTLFSLDHKLYASDYGSDSDSFTSENQPLLNRQENMQLSVGLACENNWLPWFFAASYVSPGGKFVPQQQKFHTDDINQCFSSTVWAILSEECRTYRAVWN